MENRVNSVALAAAVSVTLLACSGASAQETGPSTAPATRIDTVTVTGSRIERAGFDTLEPASVISGDSMSRSGASQMSRTR